MEKTFAWFFCCLVCAVLVGCGTVAKRLLEQPKVGLQHVSLTDVGAAGATVVFGVQVENPNSIPIRVDALSYDVEIGGRSLSSGVLNKGVEVPARNKAIVEIPVAVKYSDVFTSIMDYLSKKTSTYRVKGEAKFGIFTVPFDRAGELELK